MIIESSFSGKDKRRLQEAAHGVGKLLEIYCYSEDPTVLRRFIRRNESSERHKGHHDRRWHSAVSLDILLQYAGAGWPHKPSGPTERLSEVNTTSFNNINYQELENFIKSKTSA